MVRLRGREMKKKSKPIISLFFIGSLFVLLIICLYAQHTKLNHSYGESDVIISEVTTRNQFGITDKDGDYSDWIELYNPTNDSINLKGYGLSDDLDQPFKWSFPDIVIEAQSFLIVYASGKDYEKVEELHSNFSLNKNGDHLILTNPQGTQLASLSIPKLEVNQSFGIERFGNRYAILSYGTPMEFNAVNTVEIVKSPVVLSAPIFSHIGGIYDSSFELQLSTTDEECKIFYTLDGSEPNLSSNLYTKPIIIRSREGEKNQISNHVTSVLQRPLFYVIGTGEGYKGTVVRARTYKNGVFSDEVVTQSYFINPNYTLPIISLAIEPDYLFSYEDGIYIPGMMYDTSLRLGIEDAIRYGNYSQRGKQSIREAHIEVLNEEGKQVLSQDIGIKIKGMYSRHYYAKSLKLIANSAYDKQSVFQNVFFPDLFDEEGDKITELKTLTLRTSGNDFNRTMFRDALVHQLASPTSLVTQAYHPCILFINGEYWGIHNMRGNSDRDYLAQYYNLNKDDITILNFNHDTMNWELDSGSQRFLNEFNELLSFIELNDLSISENYEYISNQVDIENMIDYLIIQLYCANTDWPDNNAKIWKTPDGKWQWLLFDTDFGFNCFDYNTQQDTLQTLFEDFDSCSTIMIRGLFDNKEFKELFISKFYDALDSIYSEQVVLEQIDQLADKIRVEIPEHLLRWEKQETWLGAIYHKLFSKSVQKVDWEEEVDVLREFAKNRVGYLKQYLSEFESKYKDDNYN